jgi:hypothetical protein
MMRLAVITLIQLTTPTGHSFDLNTSEISSLRDPLDVVGHWAPNTHCILVMTNGRSNGVKEDCSAVRDLLKQDPRYGQTPCVLVCGGDR